MERPTISQSELEVLKILWELQHATVREVWNRLPEERWVYSTVQTLLQRLEAKGVVASTKQGRLRVYAPVVTRDDLVQERLGDLSRELCDGARAPLLQGLVSGRLTARDIAEMRALLDELEARRSARSRKKR